jgi:hypothetical protein
MAETVACRAPGTHRPSERCASGMTCSTSSLCLGPDAMLLALVCKKTHWAPLSDSTTLFYAPSQIMFEGARFGAALRASTPRSGPMSTYNLHSMRVRPGAGRRWTARLRRGCDAGRPRRRSGSACGTYLSPTGQPPCPATRMGLLQSGRLVQWAAP